MSKLSPCLVGVDPDSAVRKLLTTIAEQLDVDCAVFEQAQNLLDQHELTRPGCLVAELHMPQLSGLELQAALNQRDAALTIIFCSHTADVTSTVSAMRAGAWTVIEKPISPVVLTAEIREVFARMPRPGDPSSSSPAFSRFDRLTPKEMDVLLLMLDGEPNKSIAKRLGIGLRTVEARRQNVFLKTGTDSLAELIGLVFETAHGAGIHPSQARRTRLAGLLQRSSKDLSQ